MKEITTIRNLVKLFPRMWEYEYSPKWAETGNYRDLEDVLRDYNYELANEDDSEYVGDYNDLKGYLNCKIRRITQ